MEHSYILTASCPDRTGITGAVTGFIADEGGWIMEASQHADPMEKAFFMRIEILADSLPYEAAELEKRFTATAEKFAMSWKVTDTAKKKRAVILVSKADHCLNELLYRWRSKDIDVDIAAVISNHDDLRSFVEWHDIPYLHVPVNKENKAEAFAQIRSLYDEHDADMMVLARYMQIIPPDLCQALHGRIINIHHSFLPSFVGAKPYHQAYRRGVKLIGATCHYVTEELDAGPIIEQDVVRVDHSHAVRDMIRLGRDIEKLVLARGVRLHVQDRVLLHQHKTVIFG